MGVGTLILNRLMAGLQLNTDLGAGGGRVMEVEVEVDGRRDPPPYAPRTPPRATFTHPTRSRKNKTKNNGKSATKKHKRKA